MQVRRAIEADAEAIVELSRRVQDALTASGSRQEFGPLAVALVWRQIAAGLGSRRLHLLPATVGDNTRSQYDLKGHRHMQLDQFTIALLILRPDAPQLDDDAEAALQDAHMAHLADLHEAGHLLAAGPLLGDETFRGLSILKVGPEQALTLKEQDPAVRAGRYAVKVLPWLVPGGAMAFFPTSFPRSVAEVEGG